LLDWIAQSVIAQRCACAMAPYH